MHQPLCVQLEPHQNLTTGWPHPVIWQCLLLWVLAPSLLLITQLFAKFPMVWPAPVFLKPGCPARLLLVCSSLVYVTWLHGPGVLNSESSTVENASLFKEGRYSLHSLGENKQMSSPGPLSEGHKLKHLPSLLFLHCAASTVWSQYPLHDALSFEVLCIPWNVSDELHIPLF